MQRDAKRRIPKVTESDAKRKTTLYICGRLYVHMSCNKRSSLDLIIGLALTSRTLSFLWHKAFWLKYLVVINFNILQMNTTCNLQMADSQNKKLGGQEVITFEVRNIEALCLICLHNHIISNKIYINKV